MKKSKKSLTNTNNKQGIWTGAL